MILGTIKILFTKPIVSKSPRTLNAMGFLIMKEVFKDVPNYKGTYQCSDKGNIKSLLSGKILSNRLKKNGYLQVALFKDKKRKDIGVHVLVAMCFHEHTPCGMKVVVNHKDFNKQNNHKDNLEVVTQRVNSNRKHLKSTSKYTGVAWNKRDNKWAATIVIDSKKINLGYFDDEKDASIAYNNKLKDL